MTETKEEKRTLKTYCTQNDGDCETCSLVNYGKDCKNKKIEEEEGNEEQ
jgi:hypothetical protein